MPNSCILRPLTKYSTRDKWEGMLRAYAGEDKKGDSSINSNNMTH